MRVHAVGQLQQHEQQCGTRGGLDNLTAHVATIDARYGGSAAVGDAVALAVE